MIGPSPPKPKGDLLDALVRDLLDALVRVRLGDVRARFPALSDAEWQTVADESRERAREAMRAALASACEQRSAPVPEDFDGARGFAGADTEVLVPSPEGIERIAARYALVPAAWLKPSHDPVTFSPTEGYDEELQERDYTNDPGEQLKVVRNAQNLVPALVINTNPDAVNGPPIVAPDGQVLGGNSRAMSILRVLHDDPKRYDAPLWRLIRAHGPALGFGDVSEEDTRGLVLVRLLTGSYDAATISAALNRAMTQTIGQAAGSVSLGRQLPVDLMEALAEEIEEAGSLRGALRASERRVVEALRRVGIIRAANTADWLDARTGRLTTAARDRIEGALVGALVGDKAVLASVGGRLMNALERIAPPLLAAHVYDPDNTNGYDLLPALRVALPAMASVQGRTVQEFNRHFANMGLFAESEPQVLNDQDPLPAIVLRWLFNGYKSPAKLGRAAADYYAAIPAQFKPGGDLFARTPEQLAADGDDPDGVRVRTLGVPSASAVQSVGVRAYLSGVDPTTPQGGLFGGRVPNPPPSGFTRVPGLFDDTAWTGDAIASCQRDVCEPVAVLRGGNRAIIVRGRSYTDEDLAFTDGLDAEVYAREVDAVRRARVLADHGVPVPKALIKPKAPGTAKRRATRRAELEQAVVRGDAAAYPALAYLRTFTRRRANPSDDHPVVIKVAEALADARIKRVTASLSGRYRFRDELIEELQAMRPGIVQRFLPVARAAVHTEQNRQHLADRFAQSQKDAHRIAELIRAEGVSGARAWVGKRKRVSRVYIGKHGGYLEVGDTIDGSQLTPANWQRPKIARALARFRAETQDAVEHAQTWWALLDTYDDRAKTEVDPAFFDDAMAKARKYRDELLDTANARWGWLQPEFERIAADANKRRNALIEKGTDKPFTMKIGPETYADLGLRIDEAKRRDGTGKDDLLLLDLTLSGTRKQGFTVTVPTARRGQFLAYLDEYIADVERDLASRTLGAAHPHEMLPSGRTPRAAKAIARGLRKLRAALRPGGLATGTKREPADDDPQTFRALLPALVASDFEASLGLLEEGAFVEDAMDFALLNTRFEPQPGDRAVIHVPPAHLDGFTAYVLSRANGLDAALELHAKGQDASKYLDGFTPREAAVVRRELERLHRSLVKHTSEIRA